ncbi:uncharacterized protein LOC135476103 [Liolophura sinensis]|uniref:uncharacterized protein LOC135476103 n=1 Tax=Liolophura sinensis TaxID=3198878 RepID=UPI003158BE68
MAAVHLLALTLLFMVATRVLGIGEDCSVASDCAKEECCLSHGGLKGKREALGSCHALGHSGQKCFVENRFASHGVYYSCPCASGYHCKGQRLIEIPYGETGTCERRVKSCATGADCAEDECCMSLIRPIGKRKRAMNECRKLGNVKDSCLVSLGSGKKDHSTFQCPCKASLKCHPNGQFDMPLGAMGYCG